MKLAQAASVVTDLARQKNTLTLPVMDTANTFYLHTDTAAVRIVRWQKRQVELTVETRPPIAWRVETDYDEYGVYAVAIQRLALGNVAQAVISALVPTDLHLALRLQGGLVSLDHVHGTLHIPPADALSPSLPDGISESSV